MSETQTVGDPRFFAQRGPFSVAEIAAVLGIEIPGTVAETRLFGVAPLQVARPDQVSFLDNRKYIGALVATRAGAVIVHPSLSDQVPEGCVALVTREPYVGWARVAAMFHPGPSSQPGRHPTAIVDASAVDDASVEIGPYVVIGPRAEIAAGCRLGAFTVIEAGVVLGEGAQVGTHCTISHAIIGARVKIFPGVRIGQDGFGFATLMQPTGPKYLTVPQLGRVMIADDVEIGANTTIDRGSAQDTVIGAGTRLDNLVQIGHNVRLGRACVIVAQVGISGSTILEDFVVVAGQAGFAGHLTVGRGARIGGQAGIMSDIPAGQEYLGSPAQPAKQFFRQMAILRKMEKGRAARMAAAANTSAPGGNASEPAREAGAD